MQIRKQRDFFENHRERKPGRSAHGGYEIKKPRGRRKLERPMDSRRPLHLVLKSIEAKGPNSLLAPRNRVEIEHILRARAKQFGVKIHGFANVGNHLHLLLRFTDRETFQCFLKAVAGLIARHVTGARKGRPFGKRFWTHVAFTRVVFGWRGFKAMANYIDKNKVEAEFGAFARRLYEDFDRLVKRAKSRGQRVDEVFESG